MYNRLAAVLCGAMLVAVPQTVWAGTQQFCAQWAYTYDDQGLGEDFLVHNAGQGSLGVTQALGAEAVIERDGARVWGGHLNTEGCTEVINAPAGTYTFWATAASIVQGGVTFNIFPNNERTPEWFAATWEDLPAQGGGRKDTVTFGYGHPTASVAALAGLTLQRSNVGLPDGTYLIFAQQDCQGSGFSGCFNGDSIFLGDDNLGNLEAFNKTVIAHELGHYAQNQLFGRLTNPYGYDGGPGNPLCSCDHVTSSNQVHCLQSIEHISAAQVEGYAHFFAANLLNDGAQADAAPFAYYKEVNAFDKINPPPFVISSTFPHAWRLAFCPFAQADNGDFFGTELDWMNFYYMIHNTGGDLAFSFDDLRNLYRTACGDRDCAGGNVSYIELSAYVVSLFSEAKAAHWSDLGASRGVVP